jgi:DNA mismatch endonuclease (patch repair protein)
MRRVKGKHTKPEIFVRRAVHAAGFRFRLHSAEIPGKPDLVLPRYNLAVWVHGCFWHSHTCRKGRLRPRTNSAFWQAKLDANIRRDQRSLSAAAAQGWVPIIIWECSLMADTEQLVEQLRALRGMALGS